MTTEFTADLSARNQVVLYKNNVEIVRFNNGGPALVQMNHGTLLISDENSGTLLSGYAHGFWDYFVITSK